MELNLNQILFEYGVDNVIYHAYMDGDGRFMLCHENDDEGCIDYTIYTRTGYEEDGGCFDYEDDEDFKGYTLEELLEFAEFQAIKEIPNADEISEAMEEIDDLRFNTMQKYLWKYQY